MVSTVQLETESTKPLRAPVTGRARTVVVCPEATHRRQKYTKSSAPDRTDLVNRIPSPTAMRSHMRPTPPWRVNALAYGGIDFVFGGYCSQPGRLLTSVRLVLRGASSPRDRRASPNTRNSTTVR